MDAALNWLFTLQAAPEDQQIRAEFETWRRAEAAHAEAFAVVADAWVLPDMDTVAGEVAQRTQYPARAAGNVAPLPRSKRRNWAKAAMAAAAAVLIAVGVQQYPTLKLRWQADYLTVAGARQEVMLPDGSRMILNTASAVSLDFEGTKRSVTLLQGEAYFDVVPDALRPFTVAAAFSEVTVKGTAFSVRSDSEQDSVILERGLVDVSRLPDREQTASLKPGESIVATEMSLSPVQQADPATSLAWLQGQLIFEDRPFDQVLNEVARYYGHSIIVANDRLKQIKINGNYRLSDPERAVRSLATAAGASVTRLPGGILILQ
ncbi:FecR domain-containing protein [Ancylobacter sp. A5.8]|uniref:FecR family protein n=1 Tax=Ancylobacter gelatini TaxID=2919920 RepID=UPI001F4DE067|nr:FecR domain-containing protein [Ancylobacter gelatini]MCJ8145102.1 FecR domain-containing protein [Ancylobacter gelatini]